MVKFNLYTYLYYKIKNKRLRRYLLKKIVQKEDGYAYSKTARKIFKDLYGIEIGYGSYGGCFSIGNIPPNVSFGNYCSVASQVRIFRANHPMDEFTTHPILYNPVMGYVKKDMLSRQKLEIGNDVWIGEGVIILPSVKRIGNGAVIGAGSVLTKDVEPYTIVVGNPAKAIKHRFSEEVINKLENSKWWEMEFEELTQNIERLHQLLE
jgi:acetyltransferase-like isoleucine patch superfamily enzyme